MAWRKLVYGVLGIALAIYLCFLGYRHFGGAGATLASFDRLEIGMTKWEVRGVLGWEQNYSGYVIVKGQVHVDVEGSTGTAMLAFDAQDRLIWKGWNEARRRPSFVHWCDSWPEFVGIVKVRE